MLQMMKIFNYRKKGLAHVAKPIDVNVLFETMKSLTK